MIKEFLQNNNISWRVIYTFINGDIVYQIQEKGRWFFHWEYFINDEICDHSSTTFQIDIEISFN